MKEVNDNPGESKKPIEPTLIEIFTGIYPEIFNFFKGVYIQRKAELRTKLNNRLTKEEKELLLSEESKKVVREFESHPLSGMYQLMSKPISESKAIYESTVGYKPAIYQCCKL